MTHEGPGAAKVLARRQVTLDQVWQVLHSCQADSRVAFTIEANVESIRIPGVSGDGRPESVNLTG
jgi:hypothetical protein